MNIIDTVKAMIARNEVKESSANLLEDSLDALITGNTTSIAKIMKGIAESPFFLREQIFWTKFESFLAGVYASDKDRASFCAKLAEDGKQQENALRLIECIDRAETKRKSEYITNAGRVLSAGFVSLPDFFRICHAITNNIDEDLQFLAENLLKSDIEYSISVQGLLSSGLMYQSTIDTNGQQKYSFTALAEMVDRCAVSFRDDTRYPDPSKGQSISSPQISIPPLETGTFSELIPSKYRLEPISNKEIDEIAAECFDQ